MNPVSHRQDLREVEKPYQSQVRPEPSAAMLALGGMIAQMGLAQSDRNQAFACQVTPSRVFQNPGLF